MKIVVLKFGGTSVGSIQRIKNVAKISISYLKKNYKIIVVSSAMKGETNKLVKLTRFLIIFYHQNMILYWQLENRWLVH